MCPLSMLTGHTGVLMTRRVPQWPLMNDFPQGRTFPGMPGSCLLKRTRLSHLAVRSFGSWSKHSETGQKSIAAGLSRFVGTAPGILGLVSSGSGGDLGPKSLIVGRILNHFRAKSVSSKCEM